MIVQLTQRMFSAALILGIAVPAMAATHVVNQSGFTFVPDAVTIAEGDTVEWVWSAGSHTVTEGPGPGACAGCAFDSPLNSGTPTYSVTFDAAFLAANPRPGNVYDYYCQPHHGLGMLGSITVEQGGPVPTVSEWGLIMMGAVLLGVGAIVFSRRRSETA